MIIETPEAIESVAWDGELVAPESMRALGAPRLPVTIGRPEVWPVADALEIKTGDPWVAPVAHSEFWLVRLACTLHPPRRFSRIVEGRLGLNLAPKNPQAPADSAYAFSLFPDRLGVEDQREFTLSLGPKLTFGPFQAEGIAAGARIAYRKVFPVIQSYGAGESSPYWRCKTHRAHPLEGSQFFYVVVGAATGTDGIRGEMELAVSIDTDFGLIRLGLPRPAKAAATFSVP